MDQATNTPRSPREKKPRQVVRRTPRDSNKVRINEGVVTLTLSKRNDSNKSSPERPVPGTTPRSSNGQIQSGALPQIGRPFMVTHKSDNWKARQAARQKGEEQQHVSTTTTPVYSQRKPRSKKHEISSRETRTHAREFQEKVEKTGQPSGSTPSAPKWFERRYSADDAVLSRQKQSVNGMIELLNLKNQKVMNSIADPQHSQSLSALISPRQPPAIATKGPHGQVGRVPLTPGNKTQSVLPTANQSTALDAISEGNSSVFEDMDEYEKPLDEGFEDELEVLEYDVEGLPGDDVDDESSGFHDSLAERVKRMVLLSDDFDTDLSEEESGEEDEKPRTNKTLHTYQTACLKYQIQPNPSFMRQCGFSMVDIRNRMLTSREARPISIALVADKKTCSLDISDNPLGPMGTAFVAEMLYANKKIIELNLSKTLPGREGLVALTQTLPYNTSLKCLQLDSNNLQQKDGDLIAQIITRVPDLREIHLEHNALGFYGTKQIALALAANKGRLSVLNLKYNNIRTDSAVQIALALAKNTTLKTLNLSWNGFGFDGCRALAVSLAVNKTLRELDLTCNRLGIAALGYLIKGLNKNSTLSVLKVARNPLTTEGAKALVSSISSNEDSGLTDVDLRDVPVDEEFLKLANELREKRIIRIHHDHNIHMATTDQHRDHEGNELDRFDPTMVLFEYMKKDNLRVIDLFQFFDQRKRDKLSKSDLRDGINVLMIPFTEDAIDNIMKTLDVNRDGYISLEEMMKGYREMDRIVKLRRIKANQRRKPDKGLEDLWRVLKETIEKRKAENDRRSAASHREDEGGASGGGGAKSEAGQRKMSKAGVEGGAKGSQKGVPKKGTKKKSKSRSSSRGS